MATKTSKHAIGMWLTMSVIQRVQKKWPFLGCSLDKSRQIDDYYDQEEIDESGAETVWQMIGIDEVSLIMSFMPILEPQIVRCYDGHSYERFCH